MGYVGAPPCVNASKSNTYINWGPNVSPSYSTLYITLYKPSSSSVKIFISHIILRLIDYSLISLYTIIICSFFCYYLDKKKSTWGTPSGKTRRRMKIIGCKLRNRNERGRY